MRQIVYFSTAAGEQDATTVAAIWAVSREEYQRAGLTGLLVAGGRQYLEVIEGPPAAVEAQLERLRLDQRHAGMAVLIARKISARAFLDWSATYFLPTPPDAQTSLTDMIERLRALTHDPLLSEQLDCLIRSFDVAPSAAVASPWTTAASYGASALDRRH